MVKVSFALSLIAAVAAAVALGMTLHDRSERDELLCIERTRAAYAVEQAKLPELQREFEDFQGDDGKLAERLAKC